MSEQERLLIERAQSGDVESFEKLIKAHQAYAYNIAYRMVGNEEDAKDASQEALIKVFKSLKNFSGDSAFSTWLYRIVMNTCKDLLRKRKTNEISIDKGYETDEGQVQIEIEDTSSDPVTMYEEKEVRITIEDAIDDLPNNYKSVVVLREVQGLSYDEIAEIEDIPVGTVRSRINRGRRILREVLKEKLRMQTAYERP